MKIKTVCEITNLTDRTVRFYIEQGLISPHFEENYLGRKNFEFSMKDVEELKRITILRKFDFTIEEIKQIINNAENTKSILPMVKERTQRVVDEGQKKLLALSQINMERAYNMEELANELLSVSASLPEKEEKPKGNIWKSVLSFLKSAFIFYTIWYPVFVVVSLFIISLNIFSYPVFIPKVSGILLLLLVLPLLYRIVCKVKRPWAKIGRIILLCLCVVNLFISQFFMIVPIGWLAYSETTDMVDYRDFDADCIVNRNLFFQQMFPTWPHYFERVRNENGELEDVYLDAKYYYRYMLGFDYAYDVYAEWPLEEDEFYKEVERVTALFETKEFCKIEKGSYQCLIVYSGSKPFEKVKYGYYYNIFAYDENSKRVRYISGESLEEGSVQPYYLELDW